MNTVEFYPNPVDKLTPADIHQGLQIDLTLDAMVRLKKWESTRRYRFIRRKLKRIHLQSTNFICPRCLCSLTPRNISADLPLCNTCAKKEKLKQKRLCSCGKGEVRPGYLFCKYCR